MFAVGMVVGAVLALATRYLAHLLDSKRRAKVGRVLMARPARGMTLARAEARAETERQLDGVQAADARRTVAELRETEVRLGAALPLGPARLRLIAEAGIVRTARVITDGS